MRPVIGVLPLWRAEKEQLWMRPDYLEGIMEAGGAPLIFPFTEDEELAAQFLYLCPHRVDDGRQPVRADVGVGSSQYGGIRPEVIENTEYLGKVAPLVAPGVKLAVREAASPTLAKAVIGVAVNQPFPAYAGDVNFPLRDLRPPLDDDTTDAFLEQLERTEEPRRSRTDDDNGLV